MADEAAKHGLVAAACEADGGYVGFAEGGEVVPVEDFVVRVVREGGFEDCEAVAGFVDGVGRVVDEVEGFLWWRRLGLG